MSEHRKLEAAHQRLQAVLDTAVDAIITINDKGIVTSFNRSAERLFGYTSDEVLGKNISILMPQPYRREHDSYLENYLRTGEKKIIGIGREVLAQRQDGSQFPADIAISAGFVDGEQFFTGFVRDISQRKAAEAALAKSEAFLKTIFDAEPQCVKVMRQGGIVTSMNPAGLRMVEAEDSEEVLGRCFYPLVEAADRTAFEQLTQQALAGKPGTLEFDICGLQGTRRRFNTHAVPIRDPQTGEPAVLGISHDITEQREAEDRALQAERLAAIGQTVAGLAHESRNAFQRSSASLEMLALELADQPDALELVERTSRALNHLHHLYEEVRDYAAPIRLDRQPCAISRVWRDAWSQLEVSRQDKQINLLERLPDDEPTSCECHCDWFALGQVFRNIMENAIAACPNPGKICVDVDVDDTSEPAIICVKITDNGPGVPDDVAERMFEPFYTTKPKGTGLGMAITKRIVEAHGGTIALGDTPMGTEIVVTLPRDGGNGVD